MRVLSFASGPSVPGPRIAVVASTGDEKDYEVFLETSRDAPTPQDELRYRMGLTAFRDAFPR